jgi:carboxymethylenebutenolidase
MTLQSARDFYPEVLKLFDAYVHGFLSRGDFVSSAAKFAAGGETGQSLLEALSPKFGVARQVQASDVRIAPSYVEIPSPAGYGRYGATWCGQ